MIFYYLWRRRLLHRVDREMLAFFVGATANPLFLSRHQPLASSIHWIKALLLPSYARSLAAWLQYRVELYDGLQG